MNLERRLQGDLRVAIDFLIARGYDLVREADQLILVRAQRRVLVVGGSMAVIGRGGLQHG